MKGNGLRLAGADYDGTYMRYATDPNKVSQETKVADAFYQSRSRLILKSVLRSCASTTRSNTLAIWRKGSLRVDWINAKCLRSTRIRSTSSERRARSSGNRIEWCRSAGLHSINW